MREGQARLLDHLAAVEQEVEVDRPRPESRARPLAAEDALDGEEPLEQLPWRELRLERRDGVEEAWLLHVADRISLADRRDGDDLDPRFTREQVERLLEVSAPIADVPAETDVCAHRATVNVFPWTNGSARTRDYDSSASARRVHGCGSGV